MCRLFGFRSVIQSQVHSSLVHAENALGVQSVNHPDGWGVSYYIEGAPHLIKSERQAMEDSIFQRVSGVVSSETVLAHIRNATQGSKNILNTHPFQFGHWMFAHNGNIKDFSKHKEKIRSFISPMLKRFILGDTDSEILFYFILTYMERSLVLSQVDISCEDLARILSKAMTDLAKIIGPFSKVDKDTTDTYLSFILTNGKVMLGHQGGKPLYYSTYKKKCSERDICPSFADFCEAPVEIGQVNHLIFSSEPLSGENVWVNMNPGELIGVDANMNLFLTQI